MKPKKRWLFVSFFDALASSNHCAARLDQKSRSSAFTAAAANLPHSCALVRRNFSASNIWSYRGLRGDRRTAFLAKFWLAAAARFGTLWAFPGDPFLEARKTFGLEARKTFGALRRRTSAFAAGAPDPSMIAGGASRTWAIGAISPGASISSAMASGLKGLDVAWSGTHPANDRISLSANALCACHPCCRASKPNIHGFKIISISDDRSRVVNTIAIVIQRTAGANVPAVQQS
jgi:hypothetical protein